MIAPPGGARVMVATAPVDFRKGMDGLAALVKEQMRIPTMPPTHSEMIPPGIPG